MEITKTVKISIPRTPNFIEVDGKMQSIRDFSASELEKIGKEWTDELIRRAKRTIK